MAEGLVAIGALVQRGPGSQCRRCELCRGPAWFTKASAANALKVAAGGRITWICEGCLDRVEAAPEASVAAYSPEQIAELHAAGIDASAEQLQDKVQRMGRALLRKKR
jgi:hypothetical protein